MSTTTANRTDDDARTTAAHLRAAAPVLTAVLMLFGVLAAVAFALREVVEVGVLLVSAQ
ncbi:hypothetical protein Q9R32_07545 [Actinotalea sp. AC32]|nr:hypothetical protein [Actinotalea sp. AC32]